MGGAGVNVVTSPMVEISQRTLPETECPLGLNEEVEDVTVLIVSVMGETKLMVWDPCVVCVL